MPTSTLHNKSSHQDTKTVKGFALYIGLKNASIAADDPKLQSLVNQLRDRLAELDPDAESYAALAIAPKTVNGRSLDIVRTALNEPVAKRKQAADQSSKRSTGVTIDFSRKQALLDGYDAGLTYREYLLLQFFVLREGLTVTRAEIADHLLDSGTEGLHEGSRAIDVQIRRLRAKLGDYHKIIRTVRGQGYRFDRHADVQIIHVHAPSPDRV